MDPQIVAVLEAVEKVSDEHKQMAFELAKSIDPDGLTLQFNQSARDFFSELISLSTKKGLEKKFNFRAYNILFDTAVGLNKKLPLEKFTLSILLYAHKIFEMDEEHFLGLDIGDVKIQQGNEFGVIQSKEYQALWKTLGSDEKEPLIDQTILMATYALAYLYATILKK